MSTATRERSSAVVSGIKWVLIALVVLVFAGVACNALVDAAADDEAPVEETLPRPLDEQVYESIELGADKEELLARLEPVEPVDGAVLERYELRSPETVATSCVYYERLGAQTGELYRLCFDGDELIDKTVVFPEAVDRP